MRTQLHRMWCTHVYDKAAHTTKARLSVDLHIHGRSANIIQTAENFHFLPQPDPRNSEIPEFKGWDLPKCGIKASLVCVYFKVINIYFEQIQIQWTRRKWEWNLAITGKLPFSASRRETDTHSWRQLPYWRKSAQKAKKAEIRQKAEKRYHWVY